MVRIQEPASNRFRDTQTRGKLGFRPARLTPNLIQDDLSDESGFQIDRRSRIRNRPGNWHGKAFSQSMPDNGFDGVFGLFQGLRRVVGVSCDLRQVL